MAKKTILIAIDNSKFSDQAFDCKCVILAAVELFCRVYMTWLFR